MISSGCPATERSLVVFVPCAWGDGGSFFAVGCGLKGHDKPQLPQDSSFSGMP